MAKKEKVVNPPQTEGFVKNLLSKVVFFFLGSTGLKRKLAAYVTVLLSVVRTVPELAILAPLLEQVAGALGVAGVAATVPNKTYNKHALLTLSAVVSTLIAVAPSFPALAPFLGTLQAISALLAAFGIASASLITVETKPITKQTKK